MSTFTSAPNIEELIINTFDSQLSQIKFNRLKSFKVSTIFEKDFNAFELFIENNTKTLKHLKVSGYYNEVSTKRFLKIITKSVNLVHFSTDLGMFDKYLIQEWTQIANNCKQLKSLKVSLNHSTLNQSLRLNDERLSTLRGLKRLEVLSIDLSGPRNDIIEDISTYHELTHLTVHSLYEFQESILTDIDINFPKLKSLTIDCPMIASEWTAQVLSRLSSLETIELRIENEGIRSQIERQLIKNCKHFKSFKIFTEND